MIENNRSYFGFKSGSISEKTIKQEVIVHKHPITEVVGIMTLIRANIRASAILRACTIMRQDRSSSANANRR